MKALGRQKNGLQKVISRAWTLGRSAALVTLVASLSACASQSSPDAAWPEQPSPAYPDPSAEGDADTPPDLAEEAPAQPTAPAPPASSLAKQYDGKKALQTLEGEASYYADSLAGNHTANGDVYDPQLMTAAHKKLKFGTIVRVVRESNGATTYVKINDRGPFGDADRIIDLSKAAAKEIGMMKAGVVKVRVEVVERPAK